MNSKSTIGLAVLAGLLTLGTITASRGQPNKSASTPEARQAVLARMGQIQAAAEALDPDKVFSYVLENDNGILAQNGKLFWSRAEALESTRQGFQRLQKVQYQFDQQRVTLLAPTVALVTGEGSSTATTQDGKTFTTRFAQSVVMVLTNAEWQMLHAHRSFPAR